MKLESKMQARVIAMTDEKSRDGQTTYYRLSILQGAECGKLSCSQEVYSSVNVNDEFIFNMQYNDEYKSFRIVGISEYIKPKADTGASTGATTANGAKAAAVTGTGTSK